jgi:predicted dehydrogenase
VWDRVERIELYGTEGSLRLPDPNTFGGPVSLRRAGVQEWEDVPLLAGPVANSRGIGAADMALALRSGAAHRASGELARHVLEAMHAILTSAQDGTHVTLRTRCDRPAPA